MNLFFFFFFFFLDLVCLWDMVEMGWMGGGLGGWGIGSLELHKWFARRRYIVFRVFAVYSFELRYTLVLCVEARVNVMDVIRSNTTRMAWFSRS